MKSTFRTMFGGLMLLGAGWLSVPAMAQGDSPFGSSRPVTLTIGFTPGGSVDLAARLISEKASQSLGQTIVVEYKPGAAGNIAASLVARNEPDGRSMVLVTSVNAVSPFLYKHMGYDPVKDLAPIARWVTTAYFMVVPTSLPVHSVQELVAYAKAHPGRLNYGSQGIGSPAHLAGELLSLQAGIKAVHVPFKGGPEVMSSMMSGDVQLSFAPIPNALPLVRAGKLRVLGVTSRERFALTPDIPTVAEQGYPDFEVVSFYGAMAPAGTPAAIRERISDEMRQALAMPEVKRKLAEQGLEAAWLSPEDFGKYFQEEMHKYGELTRRAKIEKQ